MVIYTSFCGGGGGGSPVKIVNGVTNYQTDSQRSENIFSSVFLFMKNYDSFYMNDLLFAIGIWQCFELI